MPQAHTILLVDDYPDALDVWGLYLRTCGFNVVTAADGFQAMESASSEVPDLAVVDLELPGMSGYEVARALRHDVDLKHIPLIAATGYSLPAQAEDARKAGFDSVLVKPCPPEALLGEIRRLLHVDDSPSG
jgi:CheY-like chemotaxis protein